MAALLRPTTSTYVKAHDTKTMDTPDEEDHTFCGIMFDIVAKRGMPVETLIVSSLWVRGHLGPLTVWSTPGGFGGKEEDAAAWTRHYEKTRPPSPVDFVELRLDPPVLVAPGDRRGIYVHSARADDLALVYDDAHEELGRPEPQDAFVAVKPGLAHLSPTPFSHVGAWWGAWRGPRAFVGRLGLGVRYKLWNPPVRALFPRPFKAVVRTLLLANTRRRTPWGRLHPEIVLYVLNMCRHDWFDRPKRTPEKRRRETLREPGRNPLRLCRLEKWEEGD